MVAHSMGNYVLQKAMSAAWTRKNQPLLVSLINQLVMVAAIEAVAEAFALADRAGVTMHDGPAAQPWDGAASYWEPPPELLRLCVRLCAAEWVAP